MASLQQTGKTTVQKPHGIHRAVRRAKDANPAFEELTRLGIQNLDDRFCFELTHQKDDKGTALKGVRAFWIRVKNEKGNAIEGKLFLPKGKIPEKAVLFFPGMPGDGVILADGRHAPALAKEGFAVFVTRHTTTRANGKNSASYVNCPEKQGRAKESGQEILGSVDRRESFFKLWAHEPRIALEALADSFKEFYLIGHSFGAFNVAYSLVELSSEKAPPIEKVKAFVSLGARLGEIGKDGKFTKAASEHLIISSTTDLERMVIPYVNENELHVGLRGDSLTGLKKLNETLYKNFAQFSSIRWLAIHPAKEEYAHFSETNRAFEASGKTNRDFWGSLYAPREIQKKDGTSYDHHDFADLRTSSLIEFFNQSGEGERLRLWLKNRISDTGNPPPKPA